MVVGLLVAGCVEAAVAPGDTTTTAAGVSSTEGTAAGSPTTTAVPSSTSSVSATTAELETTTTTTLPPWPEPGFPAALPPEAIPWDRVGEGWLLVDYAPPSVVQSGVDPNTTRVLFLADPENTWYGALTWQGPGLQVLDWSPDGRRILTLDYSHYPSLVITDLRQGTATTVPMESAPQDEILSKARVTRPTGRDIVVEFVDDFDQMRVRLEGLHTDGTQFALLVDQDLASLQTGQSLFGGITWLYAASGTHVVVTTGDSISLLSNQGALIRMLDTPGLGCTLSR
jgi:hypothetical protein